MMCIIKLHSIKPLTFLETDTPLVSRLSGCVSNCVDLLYIFFTLNLLWWQWMKEIGKIRAHGIALYWRLRHLFVFVFLWTKCVEKIRLISLATKIWPMLLLHAVKSSQVTKKKKKNTDKLKKPITCCMLGHGIIVWVHSVLGICL